MVNFRADADTSGSIDRQIINSEQDYSLQRPKSWEPSDSLLFHPQVFFDMELHALNFLFRFLVNAAEITLQPFNQKTSILCSCSPKSLSFSVSTLQKSFHHGPNNLDSPSFSMYSCWTFFLSDHSFPRVPFTSPSPQPIIALYFHILISASLPSPAVQELPTHCKYPGPSSNLRSSFLEFSIHHECLKFKCPFTIYAVAPRGCFSSKHKPQACSRSERNHSGHAFILSAFLKTINLGFSRSP